MRFRVLIAVLAAAAFAIPAAADASSLTTLNVRACHVGKTAKERWATFYARMHAIPGTACIRA